MRTVLLRLALLASVGGCGNVGVEALPLTVGIEASRMTAAPGDTISFVATAQGGNLIGVETDYGDSTADQYATGGARNAKVTFRHAYEARGTFTVRVTVTDGVAGQKSATVEVRVT